MGDDKIHLIKGCCFFIFIFLVSASQRMTLAFQIHRPQHFLNFTSFEDGGDGPAGADIEDMYQ